MKVAFSSLSVRHLIIFSHCGGEDPGLSGYWRAPQGIRGQCGQIWDLVLGRQSQKFKSCPESSWANSYPPIWPFQTIFLLFAKPLTMSTERFEHVLRVVRVPTGVETNPSEQAKTTVLYNTWAMFENAFGYWSQSPPWVSHLALTTFIVFSCPFVIDYNYL